MNLRRWALACGGVTLFALMEMGQQGGKEILQGHRANNQQIDVALCALFTARNRAIDRGPRDPSVQLSAPDCMTLRHRS